MSTKRLKDLTQQTHTGVISCATSVVKVKICKVGHLARFKANDEDRELLNFSVADKDDAVVATCSNRSFFSQIKEGRSVMIRNFTYKNNKLVMNPNSKLLITGSVEIPDDILEKGKRLIVPLSPTKKIVEIKDSPTKQIITVKGQLIKDEAVKTVQVGSTPTPVRNVRLSEDGAWVDITLCRELSSREMVVGRFFELTQCVTTEWQHRMTLSTTRNSIITEIEPLEAQIAGFVEGISIGETEIELTLNSEENYHDFTVPISIILDLFDISQDDDLEEILVGKIPFEVRMTVQGVDVLKVVLL